MMSGKVWLSARELANMYVDHAYDERWGKVPSPAVRRKAMQRVTITLSRLLKDGAVVKREVLDDEVKKDRPDIEIGRDNFVYKGTPFNSASWLKHNAKMRYEARMKLEAEEKEKERAKASIAKFLEQFDPLTACAVDTAVPPPVDPNLVKPPTNVTNEFRKTLKRKDRGDSLTTRVISALRDDEREWLTSEEIYYSVKWHTDEVPIVGRIRDVTPADVRNAVRDLVKHDEIYALRLKDACEAGFRDRASESKRYKKVYKLGARYVDPQG
jgi:hypothetical protein